MLQTEIAFTLEALPLISVKVAFSQAHCLVLLTDLVETALTMSHRQLTTPRNPRRSYGAALKQRLQCSIPLFCEILRRKCLKAHKFSKCGSIL